MKIGIVGAGITGLSAAFALSPDHEVTLMNDAMRPGGHSHERGWQGEEVACCSSRQLTREVIFLVWNSE